MKNTAAGRETGRSRIFGAFSRFRVFEVETRFGVSEWFVTDAEKRDDVTGQPAVIRQAATEEQAVLGLDAVAYIVRGAEGESVELVELRDGSGVKVYWYTAVVPGARRDVVSIGTVADLAAAILEAARVLHSRFSGIGGPVPTLAELVERFGADVAAQAALFLFEPPPAPAVGQAVAVNGGFPGSITEVCTGALAGMVVVRLARGSVCVSLAEVQAAR